MDTLEIYFICHRGMPTFPGLLELVRLRPHMRSVALPCKIDPSIIVSSGGNAVPVGSNNITQLDVMFIEGFATAESRRLLVQYLTQIFPNLDIKLSLSRAIVDNKVGGFHAESASEERM